MGLISLHQRKNSSRTFSSPSALVQLKSLERRLERTPELKTSYAQTIKGDFDKRFIVQVDKSDCFRVDNPREWYLPHHPVFHPHKPVKVRRVLNGAAKFHGVSLGSKLLTGSDLLQTLIHVLMRFRQHPYAVSADIEGKFVQIGVIPEDRTTLRFLWLEDQQQTLMCTKTSHFRFEGFTNVCQLRFATDSS